MKHKLSSKLSYPLIVLTVILAVVLPVSAGLGIGTNTPDPSAAVDIVSSNQGVLLPRIASPGSIASPAIGLTIYNTTDKCIQAWDGVAWTCAVGGSGSTGGSTLPKVINNTVPQVFAADYVGAISDTSFMSAAWIDNNTFAVFTKRYNTPTLNYDFYVELHNANYGQIREFVIPSMRGFDNTGGNSRQAFIAALKNGNLVVALNRWDPTQTAQTCFPSHSCWVVAVVDQLGNTVKAMQKFDSPYVASELTGLYALDNGNFIVTSRYYINGTTQGARTVVFDPTGTQIQDSTVSVSPYNDVSRGDYAATDFGYISIIASVYRSYNFSGTLLSTVNNWIPSSVINYSNTANGYYPHITRVTTDTNNTMFVSYGSGTFSPMGIATINAYTASVSYTRNVAISASAFEEFFSPAYQPFSHDINASGNLLYFGKYPTTLNQSLPVGVFADGLPHFGTDAAIPLNEYDATANQVNTRQLLSWAPGLRAASAVNGYGDPNVGGPRATMFRISPNGTRALFSATFDNTSGAVIVYDISDLDNITQLSHIALRNNQPQLLGKLFVLSGLQTTLQQAEVKITDGYKTGDTLSSVCSPASVGSVYVFNTLAISGPGTLAEFATCLNEIKFKTTAAAGPRTITVQATDTNGVVGDLLSFTLEVGP